jgi:hypothetical protein
MFMAVGAAAGALSYLQSLLAQGAGGTRGASNADPLSGLLGLGDPSRSDDASSGQSGASGTSGTGASTPSFAPGMMAALISLQSQSADGSQGPSSLFFRLDTDGNAQISQPEFDAALSNAGVDQSSADALFAKLDSNDDGSISQSELSQAQHGGHHHHMHAGGVSGQGGGLASLLSGIDASGATTQTTANADGSSTTTITYADGSKVEMTTPAPSGDSGSPGAGTNGSSNANFIERLIQMQAQLLGSGVSTTSTVA